MKESKIIPFFSAREINTIGDYERFRNTRAYIKERSFLFGSSDNKKNALLDELMRQSGYSKFRKFREHRKEWDDLLRNIPLGYLFAIGVNIEELMRNVSIDMEEYRRALKIPLFPGSAVIRLMGGFYQDKKFPPATPEYKAIEILKEFSTANRLRCCINFHNLKTIWIEPGEEVHYSYYPPEIKITKKWAVIKSDGRFIGTSCIA